VDDLEEVEKWSCQLGSAVVRPLGVVELEDPAGLSRVALGWQEHSTAITHEAGAMAQFTKIKKYECICLIRCRGYYSFKSL